MFVYKKKKRKLEKEKREKEIARDWSERNKANDFTAPYTVIAQLAIYTHVTLLKL